MHLGEEQILEDGRDDGGGDDPSCEQRGRGLGGGDESSDGHEVHSEPERTLSVKGKDRSATSETNWEGKRDGRAGLEHAPLRRSC